MSESDRLPDFVPPMLAKLGREPFDSDEHRFEVKWDGTRSVAFVEGGAHRLQNRRGADQTPRYPELAFLADLPAGTVLDGEIVVFEDDRPSFHGMLRREQARGEAAVRRAAATLPAAYVVFDLLHEGFAPLLERPLAERVERLSELVARAGDPRLVFSEGVVGAGRAFFEKVRARAIEGMVAKRLASKYLPGRRTDAWLKIKPVRTAHCAIVGWERDEAGGVRSLVVAMEDGGELVCVGKVGSGLGEAVRGRLDELLPARARAAPFLPCAGVRAEWVEPGLFCTVSYLERTKEGNLRAPVFRELFTDERWRGSRRNSGRS